MTQEHFVSLMLAACDQALSRGAQFNAAVAIAQAALETGWGNNELATQANNLFGIKATPSWPGGIYTTPTQEYIPDAGWVRTSADWRKYSSWHACVADYAGLISSLIWYQGALNHLDDADAFLLALLPAPGKPGWATDPDYYTKVKACGLLVAQLGGPKW